MRAASFEVIITLAVTGLFLAGSAILFSRLASYLAARDQEKPFGSSSGRELLSAPSAWKERAKARAARERK